MAGVCGNRTHSRLVGTTWISERRLCVVNGGSVWESNPPCPLLAGNTGFEVQEGHQNPMHSQISIVNGLHMCQSIVLITLLTGKLF